MGTKKLLISKVQDFVNSNILSDLHILKSCRQKVTLDSKFQIRKVSKLVVQMKVLVAYNLC